MLFKGKNVLITGSTRGIAEALRCSWQKRERVSRFILLSTRARDSIVLRSDFVETIQHFAARKQYCNTQREDQKGGHFSIPPSSRSYAAASRSMSSE